MVIIHKFIQINCFDLNKMLGHAWLVKFENLCHVPMERMAKELKRRKLLRDIMDQLTLHFV